MDNQNAPDGVITTEQLKKYAEDLKGLYVSEKRQRMALESAKQQLEKYASDFAVTYESLRRSEKRYRALFEFSPVSLWEADLSRVKQHIEGMRSAGVDDFRGYFNDHRDEVLHCISMIRMLDVNQAALELYEADTKEQFFESLQHIYANTDCAFILEVLLCIAEGHALELECLNRTLKGKNISVLIKANTPPGYEVTWERVFISVYDLTEIKAFLKARERIINHLSHELRTPLAIIMGAIDRLSKKTEEKGIDGMGKTVERAKRNVNRLLDLQGKIEDVLEERAVREKAEILNLIESAASIVGELQEETNIRNEQRGFISRVEKRLEGLFNYEESGMKFVLLDHCLHEICNEAEVSMQGRELKIARTIEEGLQLTMDEKVLRKIFSGLLRNAIENTPDGGLIEVAAQSAGDESIWVHFRDYGMGITEEDQKNVFVGFFHTQDTNLYSTKKPYEFNAGGAGADLLRIKVFSERYGFSIQMESTRCKYRPTDGEECPGNISRCPYIAEEYDCLTSGGTTFSIYFSGKAASA
jgi:signal transduction histidine kinase